MEWRGEFSEDWVKRFALFPTSVERGRKVVWLQPYWKKYVKGDLICEKCQLELSDRVIGHWITTSINPAFVA